MRLTRAEVFDLSVIVAVQTHAVQPLQVWCGDIAGRPGVRCATPGYVVGLLRSHINISTKPKQGLTSKPRVAQRTLGYQHQLRENPNGVQREN
jgi:hypothetical protein